MTERSRYYTSRACNGHLDAGRELEIKKYIYFHEKEGELSELVLLPLETLVAMSAASVTTEEAIFEKLCAATEEWETQAQETGRLDAAIDYVRTKEVEHTANQWKKHEYGYMEISNRVYKMTYRTSENTHYNYDLKKSVVDSWSVTWDVRLNAPDHPGGGYYRETAITGQDQKRFTDKEAMEKYIQGRIAAYADLFTEISPVIPEGYAKQFCVHGELRPGYTVEEHKPTVAELLDSLDGIDIELPVTMAAEPPTPKGPDKPQKKPHPHGHEH